MEFEHIVIGKGLIGSAAARHLSRYSQSVAVIGPDEPENLAAHRGVFGSHYDQGRITRLIDRDLHWAEISRLAIAEYNSLEEQSGISFHDPVGMLIVDSPEIEDGHLKNPLDTARTLNITHDYYPVGDRSWQPRFPFFDFPESHWVIHEPSPAGYINPRKMLEAQLALASEQGATIIRETVGQVQKSNGMIELLTTEGSRYRAKHVLIAAGAFTNCNGLLPGKLALKPETETIIIAEISDVEAERLKGMPTLIYEIIDPEIRDVYLTPPIRYPDGQYYLKLGANTPWDQWPETIEELQTWFQRGDTDAGKEGLTRALHSVLPEVEIQSITSKPCIICRTPNGYPMIDQVGEGLFVAAGANGGGAKGSDAMGQLAAGLMLDKSWHPGLPRDVFQAEFVE